MKEIVLGMDGMTLEELAAVAREGAAVRLSKESEERIVNARKLIEKWVQEERTVYGVTTGFGALSDVTISKEETRLLQENVLMSHERLCMSTPIETIFPLKLILFLCTLVAMGSSSFVMGLLSGLIRPRGTSLQLKIYHSLYHLKDQGTGFELLLPGVRPTASL